MSTTRSVFLIGAGYIGLNVLYELLSANYQVTVLVRRPEQASHLKQAGAKPVVGTLDDLDLLKQQTSEHEMTINTSSSDDLESVEAILAGVRRRVQAGQATTFIHTGGTGVLEDGAQGMYKNEKVYKDDTPEDIKAIPLTAMHRNVDVAIEQAAYEFGDKAKVVIILPPLVYGINSANQRHSFALVALIRFALKHGFVGYVGNGSNVWSVIHVKDLGRAYMGILKYLERASSADILENPYFFAENGSDTSMRDIAREIAQKLHTMGKIPASKTQTFTDDDYNDVLGPMTPRGLGCNSRSRAIRLRELGWNPIEKDVWASWREDAIPSIVAALEAAT
ncbi:Nn.00g082530.m01.CDS01 [Neocucurbitaria sp. VM-36]